MGPKNGFWLENKRQLCSFKRLDLQDTASLLKREKTINNRKKSDLWQYALGLGTKEYKMADHTVQHFQNDIGVAEIKIGVSRFMCCGASEPHDHPHVFLDMGTDTQIVCPYCSTLYSLSNDLNADQSDPTGCNVKEVA